jgi:histone-lysine N-methyltransferase MLL3
MERPSNADTPNARLSTTTHVHLVEALSRISRPCRYYVQITSTRQNKSVRLEYYLITAVTLALMLQLGLRPCALCVTSRGASVISCFAPAAASITTAIALTLLCRSTQWSGQAGSAPSARYAKPAGQLFYPLHSSNTYYDCFNRQPGDDNKMLVCDTCDKGYHIFCLRPVMTTIPKNGWKCKVGFGLWNLF